MTAKSDVIVKLVLVFFISLLSFSIGTFVGKKYSDNQHKLASLEPDKGGDAHRDVASIVDHDGKPDANMTDDEIAKLAQEFADDNEGEKAGHGEHGQAKTEEKHGEHGEAAGHGEEKQVAKHDDHGSADHSEEATHKAETKMVEHKAEKKTVAAAQHGAHDEEPQAPAHNLVNNRPATNSLVKAAQHESRQPSSIPKDVAQYSVGKFTVQVAAFGSEGEAKKKAEQLKEQGYSSFYLPASVKGKTWYRVNVGLFATEKEAKDYRVEFASKSKLNDVIIQKIAN